MTEKKIKTLDTEKKEKILDEDGCVIRINKEVEKRKRDEVKAVIRDGLLSLATEKYSILPIDDALRRALIEGKRLTGNAYQRHLSFLVRLVHEQDHESIIAAFNLIHHPHRNDPAKINEIEGYRDRIIAGDKEVFNELLAKFADVDIQYLRQLGRNASKELKVEIKKHQELAEASGQTFSEPTKPTKSAKLLYQDIFKLELL